MKSDKESRGRDIKKQDDPKSKAEEKKKVKRALKKIIYCHFRTARKRRRKTRMRRAKLKERRWVTVPNYSYRLIEGRR